MALWSRLRGKRDPLEQQAERLVASCNIQAVGSFVPASDQFDFLRARKSDDWDFFATVAAVNVALNNLASEVSSDRAERLNSIVTERLREWDARGAARVQECQQFVLRTMAGTRTEPGSVGEKAATALGLWLLWNLLRREPSFDEFHAAPAIGRMPAGPLHDWWHRKA